MIMVSPVRKHALANAVEHGGKADAGAVLGRLIAEDPSVKTRIKEIITEIKKTVDEVNSLSPEQQKKEFDSLGMKVVKKKVEEKYELPELPDAVKGKVITAFPPEPSKFPHLGHAKAALANFLYAKKYNGKFFVRFEDSNPELAKDVYYNALIDGLKWLGMKWDKLDYLSDHVPKYYEAIESLLKNGHAYVCLCKQETIKERRAACEGCEHRGHDAETNMKLWKKMLKKFKEGDASVRLKIDMAHPNALMRDPSIARIIEASHPRTKKKYRVWPIYDFGTSMLDIWEGITHRVRSKEFEIRKDLQQHIQKIFGAKPPHTMEMGRFNLEGVPSSGRIIREMIKNKELLGWDDPRLTTLIALKRRGFTPEAIKEFLISTGITKSESVLSWEPLEAENRKVIDPISNRYSAVMDPVEISVVDSPKISSIKINLHPDFPKRGKRKIAINSKKIFVEKEDFEKFNGKDVGLINLFSINLKEDARFVSKEVGYNLPKINWVSEPNTKIKIVMPDGKIKIVLAEKEVKNLRKDDEIQFYRIGFCRVDKTGKETVLYFTHK